MPCFSIHCQAKRATRLFLVLSSTAEPNEPLKYLPSKMALYCEVAPYLVSAHSLEISGHNLDFLSS